MKKFRDPEKLRAWCSRRKKEGVKIALVPTMGALHRGHLSLVKKARAKGAGEIVVSIFVNPVQFGPGEDYAKYPRDEKADIAKCASAGATAVFIPSPAGMYRKDHSVYVDETSLSAGLCGARRPGHFRGVCTVVAKLFNIVQPDFAVFGRKDYQQAQIVRRMARDLDFPVKIVVAPVVRERDGLALSSRNAYLSADERKRANAIAKALSRIASSRGYSLSRARADIEKAGLAVDYIECVDAETLSKRKVPRKGCAVLAAAYCGRTRLIDNVVL